LSGTQRPVSLVRSVSSSGQTLDRPADNPRDTAYELWRTVLIDPYVSTI